MHIYIKNCIHIHQEMEPDTGNHHHPSPTDTGHPRDKLYDSLGFRPRSGGQSPVLTRAEHSREVLWGADLGTICGLLGVSNTYSLILLTVVTAVFFFKIYINNVKIDRPLDNESIIKVAHELSPWVYYIRSHLLYRLVRWVLLALVQFRVKYFCVISAKYISTASIVFSVFWASRKESVQIKIAVSIWLICIALLRGRLATTNIVLRFLFDTIVDEAVSTITECWASSVWLFDSILRLRDGLIQKIFGFFLFCWRFCWQRCGVTVRSPISQAYNHISQEYKHVSQEYKHSPLGEDRNIRLFQLYSWNPFLGVRGTLRHYSLDSTPAYEAISYHWGTISARRKMFIDGMPLSVSEATYDVLHARSCLWRSRLVWIDYICIDQLNLPEKAGQICLMNDIYHQASRVIVWLGKPSSVKQEILVYLLLRYYSVSKDVLNVSMTNLTEQIRNSRSIHPMPALAQFLNNPWFTRVWVIQEVVVATKLEFVYGGLYFDWAMLEFLFQIYAQPEMSHLLHMSPSGNYALENLGHLGTMMALRQIVLSLEAVPSLTDDEFSITPARAAKLRKRLNLGCLLSDFSSFQVTDPRDRVFAVLNLTRDEAQEILTPNYSPSISTQDVYFDAARFVFGSHDPLGILPFAGIGYEDRLAHMPSWVPDWSHFTSRPKIQSLAVTDPIFENMYQASGNKKPWVRVEPNTRVLSLAIIKVDEIAKLGPLSFWESLDDNSIMGKFGVIPWHEQTYQLAVQGISDAYPFKSNQPRSEAFWRTLVGDKNLVGRPAPATLGCNYYEYLEGAKILKAHLQPVPSTLNLDDPRVLQPKGSDVIVWRTALTLCASGRRFCITNKGYMGMVPPLCKPTDVVCIILGALTPYIIRRSSDNETSYEIVGECYMHGMMDGEMLEAGKVEQLKFV